MTTTDKYKPTDAMRRALEALWGAEDKKLFYNDFLRSMQLTSRGRYLVMHRMLERNWVTQTGDRNDWVTITFGGMQAIGVHLERC